MSTGETRSPAPAVAPEAETSDFSPETQLFLGGLDKNPTSVVNSFQQYMNHVSDEMKGQFVPALDRKTRGSNDLDLTAMFKALGDPTRRRIFEFLRESCCPVAVEETGDVRATTGPTAGEVCCNVTGADKVTSGVSFHLKELRLSGLVTMERQGKNQICGINQDAVAALAAYFSGTGTPE